MDSSGVKSTPIAQLPKNANLPIEKYPIDENEDVVQKVLEEMTNTEQKVLEDMRAQQNNYKMMEAVDVHRAQIAPAPQTAPIPLQYYTTAQSMKAPTEYVMPPPQNHLLPPIYGGQQLQQSQHQQPTAAVADTFYGPLVRTFQDLVKKEGWTFAILFVVLFAAQLPFVREFLMGRLPILAQWGETSPMYLYAFIACVGALVFMISKIFLVTA
jgi:hypothetical protein